MLGYPGPVHEDDALMRGGIHANVDAVVCPPPGNLYIALIPDVTDVISDLLISKKVVEAGGDSDFQISVQRGILPVFREANTIKIHLESKQAVESDHFASGAVLGLEHIIRSGCARNRLEQISQTRPRAFLLSWCVPTFRTFEEQLPLLGATLPRFLACAMEPAFRSAPGAIRLLPGNGQANRPGPSFFPAH